MGSQRNVFFITGTDTGVGKTFASCGILQAAGKAGLSTAAIKPLAAGAGSTPQGLRNEDALALQRSITHPLSYEQINPLCFEAPIAPHLAAQQAGRRVTIDKLAGFCRAIMMLRADLTLIEGAGGWKVPVNQRELFSQLPRQLNIPVVLVVGMRLGCINHALLSAQAIMADRVQLAGWVANQTEPAMPCYAENLDTLQGLLPAPLLAEISWQGEGAAAGEPAPVDWATFSRLACPTVSRNG